MMPLDPPLDPNAPPPIADVPDALTLQKSLAHLAMPATPKKAPKYRHKPKADPFDVELSDDEEKELIQDLVRETTAAQDAINTHLDNIDYWWTLYESGQSKITHDDPWPGAADLTSYIGTEKADALQARLYETIVSEPMWTVDGWGAAASRAALVEELHEWKADEEGLASYLDTILTAMLVETMGILEVYEVGEQRVERTVRKIKTAQHEDGSWVMDVNGYPELARNENGEFIDAKEGDPMVEAVVEQLVKSRGGPAYRQLLERDFLFMPAHARDRKEIRAYVKRFWRRLPELRAKETAGIYTNIDALGTQDDRTQEPLEARAGVEIASAGTDADAQKELFEATILRDLDGDGIEEWYLITYSVEHQAIIRLKRDELGDQRYILFVPFPRPGMVRGYSFIGHKLYTLIEEHTGQRNMNADRSVLAVNAPIMRQVGSAWDAQEQPFGPGAIIDVKDMREIQAMEIPDLPRSAVEREQMTLAASERVAGINDISLGVQAATDRTLGENQMATAQSAVRMKLITSRIQRTAMKQLWQTRHTLIKRALKHAPAEPPSAVVKSLQFKNQTLDDGKFTSDMLDGEFRGKPHGSTETADVLGQRADFNNGITALANMAKVNPGVAMKLASPEAAEALLGQWAHVYRIQDRQAFLGTASVQAGMPQPGMPGAVPGGVPGAPPDPLAGVAGMLPPIPGAVPPPPQPMPLPAPQPGGVQ